MSSSRSIAAARNRRSGETSVKPMQPQQQRQQQRPVTSIPSQSAFSNQNMNPNMQQYNNRNVNNTTNNRNFNNTTNNRNVDIPNALKSNGLPFSKLTVSDAIGLVTLRLGRVEQFIIDTQEDGSNLNNTNTSIPENSKIIDNSVLTSIINRIDSLEKKEINTVSHSSQINNLEKEVLNIKNLLNNLTNNLNNLTNDMTGFISVTNEKFMDYENALIEIEKEASLFHGLENNIDENGNLDEDDSNENNENNENNEVIEKNESGDNSNEEENIQMISSEV
jgi:hypothetical protein